MSSKFRAMCMMHFGPRFPPNPPQAKSLGRSSILVLFRKVTEV